MTMISVFLSTFDIDKLIHSNNHLARKMCYKQRVLAIGQKDSAI